MRRSVSPKDTERYFPAQKIPLPPRERYRMNRCKLRSKRDPSKYLHRDVLHFLFSFILHPLDLCALSQVNKTFHEGIQRFTLISVSKSYWEALCLRYFSGIPPGTRDWKGRFRSLYKLVSSQDIVVSCSGLKLR